MRNITNIREKRHQVNVSLPQELYGRYLAAAESVGNTLPAWIRFALASYYRNWKGADGKKPEAEDKKMMQVIAEFDRKQEERAKEIALREEMDATQAAFDELSTQERAMKALKESQETPDA